MHMPLETLEAYVYDATTKDGRTIHIRPIEPGDSDRMLQLWDRLSPETIRLRFFAPTRMTAARVRYFTELDFDRRVALIAERGERIVGVARFDRDPDDPGCAEFAVVVEDAEQGHGIGTSLLRALVEPARELGVTEFYGEVLSENRRMLSVLRDAGLSPAFKSAGPVVTASFRTTATEEFLAAGDEHDRASAIAALRAVLEPEVVAVVGASRDPTTVGGLVFDNLRDGQFAGAVYPVNTAADVVQTVVAYPALAACPSVPDVAIICVPAAAVRAVVEDAGRTGCKAVVIISAGFREAGGDGERLEREVLATARRHGVRVVGPNCMGVLNAAGDRRMNATFSTAFPAAGNVAFSSQSGALGLAILSAAHQLGLGLSSFVSVGNKVDVSGNDLLQYWEADEATEVILLYLESFGNPRRFGRIARRVSRSKPIAVVKAGRTPAGRRAASGHTGALAAGDVAVDALFRQAGVIRTDTLEQLFGVASVLANQPVPSTNRVAILTNGGGPGILAADACESYGLDVAALSEQTQARLRRFLPAEASVGNPVDLIASASADDYRSAVDALMADPHIDSLIVVFVPPVVTRGDDVARALVQAQAATAHSVPLVSVFMEDGQANDVLRDADIPTFMFPEDAVAALGRVARYSQWRRRPQGRVVEVDDADVDAARAVVDSELSASDDTWLGPQPTTRLLAAFGIETAGYRHVHTPETAAAAHAELGVPVAVKLAAATHKRDVGGVRLGLDDPRQTARAVEQMKRDVAAAGHPELLEAGYVVQEMVAGGVELIAGIDHDPTFGPLLLIGLGGSLVELLGDVSVRIHPLTDRDADEMLTGLRGYPLLTGYRGSEPVDLAAVKRLLFRLSSLAEHVPEIAELDMNPVFARPDGVTVVDARIHLLSAHPSRRPT